MEPFTNQDKFRLKMIDNQLNFSEHSYSLMTAESEYFEGIVEQYAGLFSEHMKQ